MGHRFHLAQVGTAAADHPQLRAPTGTHPHQRPAGRGTKAGERGYPQPVVSVRHLEQAQRLGHLLAVGQQQFQRAVAVDVADRASGARTDWQDRLADIGIAPVAIHLTEDPVRFHHVVEEQFLESAVVEVRSNHRPHGTGHGHDRRGTVEEPAIGLADHQPVQPFPVAPADIEFAIAVGIQHGHATGMLLGVVQVQFGGNFQKSAEGGVAVQPVVAVFVAAQQVGTIRHERPRPQGTPTHHAVEA